jgi:hypothetical protein
MAAGDRDGIDRLGPELVGELAQLRVVEPAQCGRIGHLVEEGRVGARHEAVGSFAGTIWK